MPARFTTQRCDHTALHRLLGKESRREINQKQNTTRPILIMKEVRQNGGATTSTPSAFGNDALASTEGVDPDTDGIDPATSTSPLTPGAATDTSALGTCRG